MSSELRKVLIWLTAVVLSIVAIKASVSAGLNDLLIVRVAGFGFVLVSASMLIYALFELGGRTRPKLREGYHVHGLNWGFRGLVLVVVVGLAWFVLWSATDKNTAWLWGLAILFVVGALYSVAFVALDHCVWDDDVIWVRDWLLRWRCHKWADLKDIERAYDGLSWNLRFGQKSRVDLFDFTNSVQIILDHAQDVLNRNQGQRDDDA